MSSHMSPPENPALAYSVLPTEQPSPGRFARQPRRPSTACRVHRNVSVTIRSPPEKEAQRPSEISSPGTNLRHPKKRGVALHPRCEPVVAVLAEEGDLSLLIGPGHLTVPEDFRAPGILVRPVLLLGELGASGEVLQSPEGILATFRALRRIESHSHDHHPKEASRLEHVRDVFNEIREVPQTNVSRQPEGLPFALRPRREVDVVIVRLARGLTESRRGDAKRLDERRPTVRLVPHLHHPKRVPRPGLGGHGAAAEPFDVRPCRDDQHEPEGLRAAVPPRARSVLVDANQLESRVTTRASRRRLRRRFVDPRRRHSSFRGSPRCPQQKPRGAGSTTPEGCRSEER